MQIEDWPRDWYIVGREGPRVDPVSPSMNRENRPPSVARGGMCRIQTSYRCDCWLLIEGASVWGETNNPLSTLLRSVTNIAWHVHAKQQRIQIGLWHFVIPSSRAPSPFPYPPRVPSHAGTEQLSPNWNYYTSTATDQSFHRHVCSRMLSLSHPRPSPAPTRIPIKTFTIQTLSRQDFISNREFSLYVSWNLSPGCNYHPREITRCLPSSWGLLKLLQFIYRFYYGSLIKGSLLLNP